jgi:hypothetical protein
MSADGKIRTKKILSQHEANYGVDLVELDENIIAMLQTFTIETRCQYVITSQWRKRRSPDYFEALFRRCGYPLPNNTIIGCTPELTHIEQQQRGHEIEHWILANEYNGQYVIIDDSAKENFINEQPLIKTNPDIGLTEEDLKRIKQFYLN